MSVLSQERMSALVRHGRDSAPDAHVDNPALQVAAGGYGFRVPSSSPAHGTSRLHPSLSKRRVDGSPTSGDDMTSGTAVFSNGVLHEDVLRLIAGAVGKSGEGPTA